ncbi:hypothetical protein, partial [Streptomyces clavuligerus]|uniref:hypothetical protein n=1 Tax=Streptomyces clavuligerus TaxID=1901 RepID=UPI0018D0D9E2
PCTTGTPPGPRAPVRRPNSEAGACRWCTVVVSAGAGHQPDRDGDRVEHWLACPPRAAVNGAVCALCGRSVVGLDAHQVLAERTEDAVWETRHRPSLDCTGTPRRTWEEFQADQADKERAAERGREEARRYQERLTQARAAEEAAARAEDTVVAAHLGDRATAAPPARVLAKQLRDGRRLALYLVPTPADPGRCEILRLIDGRIDGTSRPSTRRNTDPRTMTELPCLLNIAAGTSIGLTAAEERALDKALDAWADRPLRALREAAPQASTWKMAESPEFTGIGAIVRDPLRPGRPLVVVLDVRRRWENEDGLAHGLMRDEGWLYTPTVRALTPDEYARAQREGRLPEN